MRYADLPDLTDAKGRLPLLYCPHCEGEYSANSCDYSYLFDSIDDICCEFCDEPLELVTKRVSFVTLILPSATIYTNRVKSYCHDSGSQIRHSD